ncbi:MAG: hypothetical protein K6B44_07685 [Lachnospiraceae bacterium]|nr:hypothetical protein [Lachnospiraceae bacterium]
MKKRLIAVVMAFMILAACGKEEEEVKEPAATTEHVRDNKSGEGDEAATPTPAEVENKDLKLKITTYKYCSEAGSERDDGYSFPLALHVFQKVELDGCEDAYPELKEGLDAYNNEKEDSALSSIGSIMRDIWEDTDFINYMYSANGQEENLTVARADDKVVSFCIDVYSSYNGAHPVTWYKSTTFDTQTGEQLPLCDVVNDINGLPQIILENLETVSDDYEFTDEDNAEMLTKIEDMVADNYLVWTISDTAMEVYFDPYDLQYYALGPIFATLDYSKYPDLLVDKYKPEDSGMAPLTQRIKEESAPDQEYDDEEIKDIIDQYMDQISGVEQFYAYAPDWYGRYVADDVTEELSDMPYELKQVKKEDMMFADSWANENGYVIPGFYRDSDGRYSDESGYTYEPLNDADNGELSITCYWDQALTQGYSFDLTSFLYTPNPGNDYTTMYVRYATMYDGILYVNLAHRTYSEDQPDTAYVLALDTQTGLIKWKSDNLVANSDNFLIYKDTIICGYGFTQEDDYVYILSRYTGEILKKIKVKTSPDYFVLDGDKLIVICYDTVYTYELK